MKKLVRIPLAALLLVVAGSGCDNDIDPDTLVRELRVLSIRFGDSTPGSVAELQATVGGTLTMPQLIFSQPAIAMSVIAAAPTGPGRRISKPGPRPLHYEWFACIGPLSLFSPGTLDSKCQKWAPGDPPPRENPALVPLSPESGGPSDGTLSVPASALQEILGAFLQALLMPPSGSGGSGGGGMVALPTRPITLLLPVIAKVTVQPPDGDPTSSLDSEIAYSFLRVVVALPGMTLPPPNHNPTLPAAGGLATSDFEMGTYMPLMPCPTTLFAGPGDCMLRPVKRNEPLYISGAAAPGSIEVYTPLDDSGRMDVSETMRYAWFSTDGTFNDERTGDAHAQTFWENGDRRPAPDEVKVIDVWLVVQDERGGADTQRFELTF